MKQTELDEIMGRLQNDASRASRESSKRRCCTKSEWDAMELARPGYHTLIRESIMDENQAERIARGTSGDAKKPHEPE